MVAGSSTAAAETAAAATPATAAYLAALRTAVSLQHDPPVDATSLSLPLALPSPEALVALLRSIPASRIPPVAVALVDRLCRPSAHDSEARADGPSLPSQSGEKDALRSLIASLLATESLGDSIPVRTARADANPPTTSATAAAGNVKAVVAEAEDAEEWEVVPEVSRAKLLVEQTNACKKIAQRSLGIAMACAIRDRELLESIVRHPSTNMRSTAESALSDLRSSERLKADIVDGSSTGAQPLQPQSDPKQPYLPVRVEEALNGWGYLPRGDPEYPRHVVQALVPLFDHLGLTSNGDMTRLSIGLMFDVRPIATAKLIIEVVVFLLQESFAIMQRLLKATKEDLRDQADALLKTARKRPLTRTEKIAKVLDRIFVLLRALRDRWGAVTSTRVKDDQRERLKEMFKDMLHILFGFAESIRDEKSAVFAENGSRSTDNFVLASIAVPAVHLCGKSEYWPDGCAHVLEKYFPLFEKLLDNMRLMGNNSDYVSAFLLKGSADVVLFNGEGENIDHTKSLLRTLGGFTKTLVITFTPARETSLSDVRPLHALEVPKPVYATSKHNDAIETVMKYVSPVATFLEFYVPLAPFLHPEDRTKVFHSIENIPAVLLPSLRTGRWLALNFLDGFVLNASVLQDLVEKLQAAIDTFDVITAPERSAIMADLMDRMDIRVESVRRLLQENINQRTFQARLPHYARLINVTERSNAPAETINMLAWMVHRMRNEILPDINTLLSKFPAFKVLLVKSLTLEESKNLARVLTTFDLNNAAETAIDFYFHNPSHPLFEFAMDTLWRHAVHIHGSKDAPSRIVIGPKSFKPISASDDLELKRRKAFLRAIEIGVEINVLSESEASELLYFKRNKQISVDRFEALLKFYGCYTVDEGREADVTRAVYDMVESKFKGLPGHSTLEFEHSKCCELLLYNLALALGYRWTKSVLLQKYFDTCMGVLKAAPKMIVEGMTDVVLDWSGSREAAALEFLKSPYICGSEAAISAPWYTSFADLRLQSNEATVEVNRRFLNIDKIAPNDFKATFKVREALVELCMNLSPSGSALHIPRVLELVLKNRPDLLKAEHISHRGPLIGLFNTLPNENRNGGVNFRLPMTSELIPFPLECLFSWQVDLFAKRYLEMALDPAIPLNDRVVAASRMMHISSISVHDAAAVLTTPSLPQRIMEAILMYLPRIDEPAAAVTLVLSPVFMDSDLVRTAIFTLKKLLYSVSAVQLEEVLRSLAPTGRGRRLRVSASKEVVRLMAEYAHRTKGIIPVIREVWARDALHKDVRIALLQSVIPLLASKDPDIAELAWDLCSDCMRSTENLLSAGPVLLHVRLGRNPTWYNLTDEQLRRSKLRSLLVPAQGSVYMDLGLGIVTVDLDYAVRDRFLFDVLLPLGDRLETLADNLRSLREPLTPAKADELAERVALVDRMLALSFSAVNEAWVVECGDRPRLLRQLKARALASANQIVDSAVPDPSPSAISRFAGTLRAMASCASLDGFDDRDADSVPDSWAALLLVIRPLFATMLDPARTLLARLNARTCLKCFNFDRDLAPTPLVELRSDQLRVQARGLFSATLSDIPGIWPTFAAVQFRRSLLVLATTVSSLHLRHPPPLEGERMTKRLNEVSVIMQTAEAIIRDEIMAAAFAPPACGSPLAKPADCVVEVLAAVDGLGDDAVALRARVFDSDTLWASVQLPGVDLQAIRMELRLRLLERYHGTPLESAERVAGFLETLADDRRARLLAQNSNRVITWLTQLLTALKAKCLVDPTDSLTRNLRADADTALQREVLFGMLTALRKFAERASGARAAEDENLDETAPATTFLRRVVLLDVLFFLQHSPDVADAAIRADPKGKLLAAWFAAVAASKGKDRAALLANSHFGARRMEPYLDAAAAAAGADTDALPATGVPLRDTPSALLLTSLVATDAAAALAVAPNAVKRHLLRPRTRGPQSVPEAAAATYLETLLRYPSSAIADAPGRDALSALLQALAGGWAADLDWNALAGASETEAPSLLRMDFVRGEPSGGSSGGGTPTLTQTAESASRRAALAGSLAAVSRVFVDAFVVSPLCTAQCRDKMQTLKFLDSWRPSEVTLGGPPPSSSPLKRLDTEACSLANPAYYVGRVLASLEAILTPGDLAGAADYSLKAATLVAGSIVYAALPAPLASQSPSAPSPAAAAASAPFAFPLRAALDFAATLARTVAPRLNAAGRPFAAAAARLTAARTLSELQNYTSQSSFAAAAAAAGGGRAKVAAANDPQAVVDALLLEAARKVEVNSEGEEGAVVMAVAGFRELVEELAFSAHDAVLDLAEAIARRPWQMRWKVQPPGSRRG
ncbi:hypothetical protein HK405_008891 [Cladochytrium tenue]|nr:hypothetical protein HK405_008891 [Cladochytrium tenue]